MQIEKYYQDIIEEVNKASLEIPFGNSRYQNEHFVISNELTNGRKLRHCLLRLQNRIAALRECYYNLKLEDIDIEEMQEKLADDNIDKFEKRRLKIKLEHKQANRVATEKMVLDCQIEIKDLYCIYKQIPKLTREEFEKEETQHFELKFARELVLSKQFGGNKSVAQSIDNMSIESQSNILNMRSEPNSIRCKIQNDKLRVDYNE